MVAPIKVLSECLEDHIVEALLAENAAKSVIVNVFINDLGAACIS